VRRFLWRKRREGGGFGGEPKGAREEVESERMRGISPLDSSNGLRKMGGIKIKKGGGMSRPVERRKATFSRNGISDRRIGVVFSTV